MESRELIWHKLEAFIRTKEKQQTEVDRHI